MINNAVYPKQRLSYAEKIANDNEWGKNVIDYLLLNHSTDKDIKSSYQTDYERMKANYQLYNNIINQEDFQRECNPLGIDVNQVKDEIKPYNKAANKINVILGEEAKRYFNFKTALIGAEGVQIREELKGQLLRNYMQSFLDETIQKFNTEYETEIDPKSIVSPEDIDQYLKYNYRDAREHLADQLLQYLIIKENILDIKNDSFKHALLSGYEYVWVGIVNGEPTVQILNPLGVFGHKSAEVKYTQYGLYAGYKTWMASSDILDMLGDSLKEKDIERIQGYPLGSSNDNQITPDARFRTQGVAEPYLQNLYSNNLYEDGSYGRAKAEDWLVTHVEWRSQKKVGFITDAEGLTELVNEDFKVPDYATTTIKDGKTYYQFDQYTLYWGWIPEIWEGIRIGEDIYCNIGPKKYQYRSIDNPHEVPLGYHGLCYSNMNADPISLMDRMKPFQYLYLIVAHKLKQLIARDKGQVFHFDLSMVPASLGLDKTLYYLDQLDLDLYDPLQNAETPGSYQRGKVTGATNRSNMQHIMNYIQVLAALDEQIGDVAGVNRAREGQVGAAEAVTNAMQNAERSSTITEAIYFKPHEKLWEKVLNSLLQCAQSAYANKHISRQYILDDLSVQVLKITPNVLNCDLGVFVTDSTKENAIFQQLQSPAIQQALLQNDKATFSDLVKLLKGTSVTQLEKQIEHSENKAQERQMAQIQAQQQAQRDAIQVQVELKKTEHEQAKELKQMEMDNNMQIEILKLQAQLQDKKEFEKKLELEYDKLEQQAKIEKEKINAQKDIAKMRKTPTT